MTDYSGVFSGFPEIAELLSSARAFRPLRVNAHIHTPYSFSAFESVEEAFLQAVEENVSVLGINDFIVRDGFGEFSNLAMRHRVFPLFNIEFMALLKREQGLGMRVNDPNNPGRTYFCGKGLDFPESGGDEVHGLLDRVKGESNRQTNEMCARLNAWLADRNIDLALDFDEVKVEFARDLVRERHLAKALRMAVIRKYGIGMAGEVLRRIIPDGVLSAQPTDASAVDNELRAKLFKSGGPAYVAEDDRAFLRLDQVIALIADMGGIPCYPVLLDDARGNFTEFERDFDALHQSLTSYGIRAVELIPGRNDAAQLADFVRFFRSKGFVITFGTEHNTPDKLPLTVSCRGGIILTDELQRIAYEGASIVAAHQYLRSMGHAGYTAKERDEEQYFIELGNAVIGHFISMES